MIPGRFARSATAAALAVAAFGALAHDSDRTIETVDASVSTGDRAIFVPLATPTRILDTRKPGEGPALGPGATRSITVAGRPGIPADITAVVMNVTVVSPTGSGFLSVYPAAPSRPNVSNLNFTAKQTIPNLVTVKPGTGGQVSFFNSAGTSHVLADVAGYYVGHDHDDRYLPAASAQARTAANALTCPTGQVLQAVAADGAPTCVADQTGASYDPGFGIAIDGSTISAEQGRSAKNAFTCEIGQFLQAIAADGEPTCETPPAYTPGFGIAINGSTISAQQGRSAPGAFTCAIGLFLRAIAADGAPTCVADQVGPTYTAGFGVAISGTTISAQQGRSAANAFTCGIGFFLRAIAADGAPTCVADQVGPTYTAGFGLSISGTTISAQQGRSAPSAFNCAPGSYLRAVAADGAPTCDPDSAGPTYTAGSGLTLSGTQFSSAAGPTVVPIRGDGTPEQNGTALRAAITSISAATPTKPYVVVASPGSYALGTAVLNFPPHVSLVGSGRGQTLLTGNVSAGSDGLLHLGSGTLLASLSVTNSTVGTTGTTAAIVVQGVTARIVDVAARATETSGSAFGIVAFSSGRAIIEDSTASAEATTGSAYGIYSVSSGTATIRNTDVTVAGTGVAFGVSSSVSSSAEFTHGSVTAPLALHVDGGSTLRVAHSKVVGPRSGTMACVGVYDANFAPTTC